MGELIGVKVGATTELLLHTIDIGMLTEPRNAFRFAKETSTHREYFQTVPVSRMTVSQYESLHLSEVMLPNGTLLTDFDPSTGGWHEGAMREYIGKDLISLGIDNANYGINNSEGEAGHPYIASQLTAHNSRGNYQNGVVTHGGSGGSGIVTLDNSLGNEFSHEVGHNFGIGHFPGGFKGSIHSPATAINSTWGWDADLNKFIPNFARSITNQSACLDGECQAPFAGRRFGSDSLAGGEPMSKVNHFTLYTPYTAAHIQQNLESKVVFAADSSTGFKKWDPATQTMKAYEHRVMNGNQVNAAIYKLSEAYLTDLIKDYDLVTVSMSDGNWTMYIDVPAASEANRGRTITIRHNAGYHSHLRMNGVSELMYRGLVKSYISDGNTWNESEAPDLTIAKVPESFGIPVTTLVGYYDPQGLLPSYIYPALHGAYGFTYSDDKDRLTAKDCHLEVNTHQGKRFNFKLASVRVNGTNMNKFHVNIPETSQPESAAVICGVNTLVTKAIEPAKETLSYTVNGYDQNTTYHKWGDFEQIGNVGDLYIYDNPYNGDKELFKLVYVGSDGRYGFFPTDKNNN
ncbi:MAG: M66 family metalloprotease, partial [Shewanella sp.]